eukprot:1192065-Prorocentrum_minimum.AAC.4
MRWDAYKDLDEAEEAALTAHQALEREACSRIGFIFTMYHTETWWYEVADLLLRKLVLTGLIEFVDEGSTAQVCPEAPAPPPRFGVDIALRGLDGGSPGPS